MDTIKCGFSECAITPIPYEVNMAGYGSRIMPCKGIRTDVYAKIAVLSSLKQTLYFVAIDVCHLDKCVMDILNEHIAYYCKIDVSKIVYCASHTHTGPICDESIAGTNLIYWHRKAEDIARAMKKAIDSMEDCTLETKTCNKELTYIYNRMGREEVDRRVILCVFKNLKGEIKGVFANASCHCTCLGDDYISADYPAILTEKMKNEMPGVPFLFLQGRGGDTNPNRPLFGEDRVGIYEALGKEFYETVKDGLNDPAGVTEKNIDLKCNRKTIEVPCVDLLPIEEYQKTLLEEYALMYNEPRPVFKREILAEVEYNKKCIELAKKGENVKVKAEIQTFKINDETIFVFLPFELFCITGNTIEKELEKLGYKYGKIFVIGYTNDVKTYLPPKKYYKDGGYDLGGRGSGSHWNGLPEYAENAEDIVIEQTIKLVKEI